MCNFWSHLGEDWIQYWFCVVGSILFKAHHKKTCQKHDKKYNVITFSEREEESADFKNVYWPRCPPPPIFFLHFINGVCRLRWMCCRGTSGNYTCNIMLFNFKRHNNTYEFLQRHNYVLQKCMTFLCHKF